MQYTSNFNFNLPEGTDLWNYLTQTNPNFTSLDSILKGVQDGTVTTATEVTSGTAHAVTRTLPDANVIRFTATGVWTLGDTMTIDGTPVTVVKPNGTSLQTGDYIIGSEVLGVLRATQFTVYVGGASTMDAEDVDYDNTVSGLTATDVQAAIDEEAAAIDTINSNLGYHTIATYTTTGTQTWATVLSNLFSQILTFDTSKEYRFRYSKYMYVCLQLSATDARFYNITGTSSGIKLTTIYFPDQQVSECIGNGSDTYVTSLTAPTTTFIVECKG